MTVERLNLAELKAKTPADLLAMAEEWEIENAPSMRKGEMMFSILKEHAEEGWEIGGDGVLEVLQDGFGFLRSPSANYLPGPDDIYVSPDILRQFSLRTGDTIEGVIAAPKDGEKYFCMTKVTRINFDDPEKAKHKVHFDNLTPLYPDERFKMEVDDPTIKDRSARIIDLVAPIGKGQRGLIVAPPRAGKTLLLQRMANAIAENHPEIKLIVLLIDERPEEVTDFMACCPTAEVIASTFDEHAKRHVQVADMVIEKAKRLVESKQDVVILLDSITRLARAHNTMTPMSGKILSGGVDAKALEKPKRFFGAARRIDGGGSLTIVATALVSTGSRMDEVIFEEFKGTGNMEIVLDRDIANRRIYPAFEIGKSGTRKEELLLTEKERNRIFLLRHFVGDMAPDEATNFVIRRLTQTATNEEFFQRMAEGA
nr:transcription termination factor Rho [Tabrizicola sp.]